MSPFVAVLPMMTSPLDAASTVEAGAAMPAADIAAMASIAPPASHLLIVTECLQVLMCPGGVPYRSMPVAASWPLRSRTSRCGRYGGPPPHRNVAHGRRAAASSTTEASIRNADRKSTRLNSSHLGSSYAVFCLKKKKKHLRRSSTECHSSQPGATLEQRNHTDSGCRCALHNHDMTWRSRNRATDEHGCYAVTRT